MEINITHLINDPDLWCYSGSVAEHGAGAARFTWSCAMDEVERHPLITNAAGIDEAKSWFAEFGAWDEDEMSEWDDQEVNALTLQFIAGDLRDENNDRVHRDDTGQVYFYAGE